MSQPRRAAIVGATGPTGVHLARSLLRQGSAVRVIARSTEHLKRCFSGVDVEQAAADALDVQALTRAVAECDLVVDCIGLPGHRMHLHEATARNVVAAAQAGGARLMQVSSVWAYLPAVSLPMNERHPRTGGGDWVGQRRAAEDVFAQAGAAVLHLPDFFGPHVHTSVLQQPLGEAASGKAMNWIGAADTPHEYAFVPDAMETAAALAARDAAYGERWIVPGSGPVTGREIAELASAALGRPVALRPAGPLTLRLVSLFNRDLRGFMQMVPEYLKPITYDAGKLRALLGTPRVTPYGDAIRSTLEWLRSSAVPRRGG